MHGTEREKKKKKQLEKSEVLIAAID